MTDPRFRSAIFAGVSSDSQARADKASIPDQIDTAREYIQEEGGEEVLEPFIADGYSRTGYENLIDALRDIPPLRAAVEAAEEDKIDVLVLDNFDRLGDLAKMLLTRFKRYNKQLKSARQSGRVRNPDTYEASKDETTENEIHQAQGNQIYRIQKIKRAFDVGVTKRVETGRYSRGYPYGYIKINEDGELEIDAPVTQLLIDLKDKFFEGLSLRDLQVIANKSGVPSPNGNPEWDFMSIHGILTNPFYTGKVFKNRWKAIGKKISASGKRYPIVRRNPNPTFYDGKHQALWTFEEYQRIMIEMEERYKKNPRSHPRAFSGLLTCGVCGGVMTFKQKKYRCRKHPGHIAILEADMERGIGEALAKALREYDETPPLPPSLDVTEKAKAAIDRQIEKIQRQWLEEEGNRIFTDQQAREKIKELQARKSQLDIGEMEHRRKLAAHARIVAVKHKTDLDLLPTMFVMWEKEKSNRYVRDILESIEVGPEGGCTFNFR